MSNHQTRQAFLEALLELIAHDVNQPLGAVLMTARACRRGLATGSLSPDQVRDGLDRLVADVERASDMLSRFRQAVHRPAAGRVATDLNTVLRCALADAGDDVMQLAIVPTIDLGDDLPSIDADPLQLQHVAHTLIAYTVDAMSGTREQDRSLTVRSTSTACEMTVEVEGTGGAVAITEAERMFDFFVATSRAPSGLELAVCRAIIEDHNGRLWVVPTEHGHRFCFTLPMVHEP
jgi:hypothetical protein